MKQNSTILIDGYFGGRNGGDELILASIIDKVRKADRQSKIVVTSRDTNYTQQHHDVGKVIQPFSFPSDLARATQVINDVDEIWIGSGESFNEIYPKYTLLTVIARVCGASIRIICAGATQLNPSKTESRLLQAIASQASVVSVRDPVSKQNFIESGITDIKQFADLVFDYEPDWHVEAKCPGDYEFVISVREPSDRKVDYESLAQGIDRAANTLDTKPCLLAMDTSNGTDTSPSDISAIRSLSSKLDTDHHILDDLDFKEKYAVISRANILLGMRLHSIITAISCQVPYVHVMYNRKCQVHMDWLSDGQAMWCDNIDPDCLAESVIARYDNMEFYRERATQIEKIKSLSTAAIESATQYSTARTRLFLLSIVWWFAINQFSDNYSNIYTQRE